MMDRRRIRRTRLEIPVLRLGCVAIGNLYRRVEEAPRKYQNPAGVAPLDPRGLRHRCHHRTNGVRLAGIRRHCAPAQRRRRPGPRLPTPDGNSYTDDTAQSAFLAAYIGIAENIKSMATADIQYRLELPAPVPQLAANQRTLGIKNLFNKSRPLVNGGGAYDYCNHGPRGQDAVPAISVLDVGSSALLNPAQGPSTNAP